MVNERLVAQGMTRESGVHANTPLNWSVSYGRFGLTHGRHSNDETVSNLTRRRKAGRLQDGIDRYLPISGHGECTVTRCWRESSAHRRGPTRMVQSVRAALVAPADTSIDTILQSIPRLAS